MIDARSLVDRIRDHYVDQFKLFVEREQLSCTRGAPEVKFEVSESHGLFERLYAVDFLRNDSGVEPISFEPELALSFEPITMGLGNATLTVKEMRWDGVTLTFDGPGADNYALARWFDHWFDRAEERSGRAGELSGIIHLLDVKPRVMTIDFGTAESDAFWDMIDILIASGAQKIGVD